MNPVTLSEINRIGAWLQEMCGDDEMLFENMTEAESPAHDVIERLHQERAQALELVEGIKAREADLKARKERMQARADNMKAAIGQVLRAARLGKAELAEATYSVRDGKPKLVIVDAEAVPDEYRRIKSEPDKALINQSFDATDGLPNWLAFDEPGDIVVERRK